jgi:hypothetical protein
LFVCRLIFVAAKFISLKADGTFWGQSDAIVGPTIRSLGTENAPVWVTTLGKTRYFSMLILVAAKFDSLTTDDTCKI